MSSPPRQLESRPGATNACTCNNHLLLILVILVMVFLLVMVGYDDGDGAHHVIGSSDCVLGGAPLTVIFCVGSKLAGGQILSCLSEGPLACSINADDVISW